MDKRLAVVTALLVPLAIASKFYTGPAGHWVQGYAGGSLYVMFWSLLALTIRPRLSARRVVLIVLVITATLEVLQLWHAPPLQAIRSTIPGRTLIGNTFDWADFLAYIAGAWLAHLCANRWRLRQQEKAAN